MGILNEARREFIAAPDNAKGQIVYKWPDHNIRKFSRAIVEPDAQCVFISQGQVMGTLGAGQHVLDAKELPFLGLFVDWATNSNAFKAELYFVGAREFPNLRRANAIRLDWLFEKPARPGFKFGIRPGF